MISFDPYAPARRVLSGNTATQEQRQAAADVLEDGAQPFVLSPADIARIDMYHDAVAQGDAHMCAKLSAMNLDRYGDDDDTRPVIGWLLLGAAIGAALAVWVLV